MSAPGDELQAAIERAEKAEAERDALALALDALDAVEGLADDHGWGTGDPVKLAAVRALVHTALGHGDATIEAIRDQYATRTTLSAGSVSKVSEPGHAIDLVLKDRDEWKRRALAALPDVIRAAQADAFEIAAKLVESRRPEMPSGKPVTHLIAGLIDELAKGIRALKP